MELCTTTTFQPLPNILIPNPNTRLHPKPSLQFPHSLLRLRSRLVVRATSEESDGVASTYEVPKLEKNDYDQGVVEEATTKETIVDGVEGQSPLSELLENFNLKKLLRVFKDTRWKVRLSSRSERDDSYVFLLYGGGALVTLWLASAVISAIDSIPLFPKLMEVVGLGYTIWFTSRYLLFKKNREELIAKVQVLKQQVLGSDDDRIN